MLLAQNGGGGDIYIFSDIYNFFGNNVHLSGGDMAISGPIITFTQASSTSEVEHPKAHNTAYLDSTSISVTNCFCLFSMVKIGHSSWVLGERHGSSADRDIL